MISRSYEYMGRFASSDRAYHFHAHGKLVIEFTYRSDDRGVVSPSSALTLLEVVISFQAQNMEFLDKPLAMRPLQPIQTLQGTFTGAQIGPPHRVLHITTAWFVQMTAERTFTCEEPLFKLHGAVPEGMTLDESVLRPQLTVLVHKP